jgi:predicted aspartyl protease
VSTATGQYITNIYKNALLKVQNRSAIVEIIELHDDSTPSLGVIPMEILGLEVDVIKHELRLLPDHSKDTYLLAYSLVSV